MNKNEYVILIFKLTLTIDIVKIVSKNNTIFRNPLLTLLEIVDLFQTVCSII